MYELLISGFPQYKEEYLMALAGNYCLSLKMNPQKNCPLMQNKI
jgi:hypothetical protein